MKVSLCVKHCSYSILCMNNWASFNTVSSVLIDWENENGQSDAAPLGLAPLTEEMSRLQNETTIQCSPTACRQSSSYSMRLAANQISALSFSQPRKEANSSDSVETDVMEAQSSLPPLYHHPKSFPVPQYSSAIQPTVPASQTAEVTFSPSFWSFPLCAFSHFLCLLQSEEMKQASHVKRSQMVPAGAAVSGCQLR